MPPSISSDLVFDRGGPSDTPGTHALIVGVGKYAYGKDQGDTVVGGDLRQLTSPPLSAKEFANWLIRSFRNTEAPLASVSLLISEPQPSLYTSPVTNGSRAFRLPRATLAQVKNAAARWAARLASHPDNMGIFYFCGHGASQGQQAALLLEDFGRDGAAYEGAIDVNILRGTMKNSPAIRQVYFLDCCRTRADDLYKNEESIGSRIVSIPSLQRGHANPAQQFVLFPTIDGEDAFGIQNQVSVFTGSIIDAMEFAAADNSSGSWRTTTGRLLDSVDQLVRMRVPARLINRSKPNALDATSFDFNEIDEPSTARSFVTISDLRFWGSVELECVDLAGRQPTQRKHSKHSSSEACCRFVLPEGKWDFKGALDKSPPDIRSHQRILRAPVAYVKLEVI